MKSCIRIWLTIQILVHLAEGRCSDQIQALFKRKEGAYLTNNVIRTEQTGDELQCGALCSRERSCVSVNYKMAGDEQGMCELNDKSLEDSEEDQILTPEFVHLEKIMGKGDKAIAKSCAHLDGECEDGVYTIDPDNQGAFHVRCDMTTDGGGWTVFQRRQDGSEDFNREWSDYKNGFGDLDGEFWLGLDKIHRLTAAGQNTLRVDLEDFYNATRYAKYEVFGVADETEKYRLTVGSYTGNAGDALAFHNSMKFSTKDQDNDIAAAHNCAITFHGAWWFRNCHNSHLNGVHGDTGYASGLNWFQWSGHYRSLKKSEMKVRPHLF